MTLATHELSILRYRKTSAGFAAYRFFRVLNGTAGRAKSARPEGDTAGELSPEWNSHAHETEPAAILNAKRRGESKLLWEPASLLPPACACDSCLIDQSSPAGQMRPRIRGHGCVSWSRGWRHAQYPHCNKLSEGMTSPTKTRHRQVSLCQSLRQPKQRHAETRPLMPPPPPLCRTRGHRLFLPLRSPARRFPRVARDTRAVSVCCTFESDRLVSRS